MHLDADLLPKTEDYPPHVIFSLVLRTLNVAHKTDSLSAVAVLNVMVLDLCLVCVVDVFLAVLVVILTSHVLRCSLSCCDVSPVFSQRDRSGRRDVAFLHREPFDMVLQ